MQPIIVYSGPDKSESESLKAITLLVISQLITFLNTLKWQYRNQPYVSVDIQYIHVQRGYIRETEELYESDKWVDTHLLRCHILLDPVWRPDVYGLSSLIMELEITEQIILISAQNRGLLVHDIQDNECDRDILLPSGEVF